MVLLTPSLPDSLLVFMNTGSECLHPGVTRSPGASQNREKGQHFSIFQKLAILTRIV